MNKAMLGLLSLLLVCVLVGCGGKPAPEMKDRDGEDAPAASSAAADDMEEGSGTSRKAAEEDAAEDAVEAVVETVTEATEGEETPAEEMKTEEATPAGGLVGTKWEYDGINLEFKEGNKVFLKGGPLAAFAPDGTEAEYTLEGDTFTVSVLGQEYSGTYDGTKLIVDGTEATMQ